MTDSPADPTAPAVRITDRDDGELIRRLQRNERDALAALYDAYARLAFGLAYRVLHDATEAEDILQESFLTVWRQASRLDPRLGSLRSLLLTIVHRRSIDVLRKRAGRSETIHPLDPLPSSGADPLELASAAEERDQLRRAMSDLPRDQRQAIELTYFGGLTVSEMAEQQKIPLGTAKSRLRLALGRMRKTLTEERP